MYVSSRVSRHVLPEIGVFSMQTFIVLLHLGLYVCDKYFKLQNVNHRLHASCFMFAREFLAGKILYTHILIRG